MTIKLGTLKKADNLRIIWDHEAIDFTKWLSMDENLKLLSDELGINIKITDTEAWAGDFKVDMIGYEVESGRKLIIENQLERTNHDHLGKIITYAAGHEAEFVIWIVKNFRDEHKLALDWLNEHTDSKINFFGINIELWQIDESRYAPKFSVVSEPNEWKKTLKHSIDKGELSENSLRLLSFIEGFINFCKEKSSILSLGRPQPATPAYYTIGIKTTAGWIAIKLNSGKKVVKVEYYFKEKDVYYKFKDEHQTTINEAFKEKVNWDDMEKYKGATVGVANNFNIENEATWPQIYEWIKINAEVIQSNFPQLLE